MFRSQSEDSSWLTRWIYIVSVADALESLKRGQGKGGAVFFRIRDQILALDIELTAKDYV